MMKAGDIVTLKGHEFPILTVAKVSELEVTVYWFDDESHLATARFAPELLDSGSDDVIPVEDVEILIPETDRTQSATVTLDDEGDLVITDEYEDTFYLTPEQFTTLVDFGYAHGLYR